MIRKLKQLIQRKLASIANRINNLASSVGEVEPPCREDPDSGEAYQPPPFVGSPEAALLNSQLPPVGIEEKHLLTRVSKLGQLQKSLEILKLSAAGPVNSRMEFLPVDDFGVIGTVEDLPGQCACCKKVSYHSLTCEECARLCCPDCGGFAEEAGRIRSLCRRHLKSTKWQTDNWAEEQPEGGDRA